MHNANDSGVEFRGTNLCISIFGILITPVSLSMNSLAVVIGAKRISPLMGSINGLGYSIATYISICLSVF